MSKQEQTIEKIKTIIKEVINEIWVFETPEAQDDFSSFLCSGILETMDIKLLADSRDSKSSILEIELFPVEEVWEMVEEE
jgi:hypothetical protein